MFPSVKVRKREYTYIEYPFKGDTKLLVRMGSREKKVGVGGGDNATCLSPQFVGSAFEREAHARTSGGRAIGKIY